MACRLQEHDHSSDTRLAMRSRHLLRAAPYTHTLVFYKHTLVLWCGGGVVVWCTQEAKPLELSAVPGTMHGA